MSTHTLAERLPWIQMDQRIKPTEADYATAERTVKLIETMTDAELAEALGVHSAHLRSQLREVFAQPWR